MFNYLDCKHLEAAKFCNETITHNRNGLKKKKNYIGGGVLMRDG